MYIYQDKCQDSTQVQHDDQDFSGAEHGTLTHQHTSGPNQQLRHHEYKMVWYTRV